MGRHAVLFNAGYTPLSGRRLETVNSVAWDEKGQEGEVS